MQLNQLPTDEQAILLYQQCQDQAGFEVLYKRYVQKVYQKCLIMTGNSEIARDNTQDIFMKVMSKLDTFQYRSSFSTWLYSITYNHCIDTLRREKARNMEPLRPDSICYATEVLADNNDMYMYQIALLNQLPRQELDLLKRRYEQGFSIRDISNELGMSECAVKMRLKRSRDRLKSLYRQQSRLY